IVRTFKGEIEDGSAPPYSYDAAPFNNVRYKSQTTILADTNQKSTVSFTYGSYNHVTEKDETDWGTGAAGSTIRTTSFTYLTDSNTAYASDTLHILDRGTGQTVCDAKKTTCEQSTTDYDS